MKRRTVLKSAALLMLAPPALAACQGGGGGSAGGADAPLTWISIVHTPNVPEPGGPVEVGLAENAGEEFTIQWIPAASSVEKLNSSLASGELASVVTMGPVDDAAIRTALASGMFWDVEPYLSEFPNLSKIDPDILEASRVDGKLWAVPRVGVKARYGVVIRKDWLDNLGLEVPHTLEELEEVARAFTEDDPTGTGAATVGIYDRQESFKVGFRSLSGYFGAPNFFGVADDNTIVPSFMTPEFTQAMEWYRGLYEKGYINQEFVTVQKQNQIDGIAQGLGGIVFTGLFEAKNYLQLAQSTTPDTPMEWALVNDMTFGDVPRRILSDTNGGLGGWLAVPVDYAETEDDLRRVLAFIDSLFTEEAFTLMTNGVEGTHFTLDADGVVTIIDQTKWEQEVRPFSSSRPDDHVIEYLTSNAMENEANRMMAENEEFVVLNPALSLSSATYNRQWTVLEQQVSDAYSQYITGQIEMADFQAVVEGLRGQGLDDIIAEFTTAYQESQG